MIEFEWQQCTLSNPSVSSTTYSRGDLVVQVDGVDHVNTSGTVGSTIAETVNSFFDGVCGYPVDACHVRDQLCLKEHIANLSAVLVPFWKRSSTPALHIIRIDMIHRVCLLGIAMPAMDT